MATTADQAKSLASKQRWAAAPLTAAIAAFSFSPATIGWSMLVGHSETRSSPPISRSWCSLSPISPAIRRQDYFADGITENLTTDLSRLSGSFVIARNTAFTYKGKNVDAKEIGKELGVRYVLEGSVQRDQNQVRVNAQLIDAKTGGHLWAERFDKPLSNLFSMQDDIVASLASQLGAS